MCGKGSDQVIGRKGNDKEIFEKISEHHQ